ncbi:hypothetical protein GUJ93_ZPchr0006g44247 [Zizania palustris]|uniref:Uncharacterized protein n=1 Tax=Zizania palustris TaxID=103762 RepID=A0A8J5TAT6_ZIZPA|nr:hypothetical protein GUJ93_ZPchr0006g44247 [Zizania palustris]
MSAWACSPRSRQVGPTPPREPQPRGVEWGHAALDWVGPTGKAARRSDVAPAFARGTRARASSLLSHSPAGDRVACIQRHAPPVLRLAVARQVRGCVEMVHQHEHHSGLVY